MDADASLLKGGGALPGLLGERMSSYKTTEDPDDQTTAGGITTGLQTTTPSEEPQSDRIEDMVDFEKSERDSTVRSAASNETDPGDKKSEITQHPVSQNEKSLREKEKLRREGEDPESTTIYEIKPRHKNRKLLVIATIVGVLILVTVIALILIFAVFSKEAKFNTHYPDMDTFDASHHGEPSESIHSPSLISGTSITTSLAGKDISIPTATSSPSSTLESTTPTSQTLSTLPSPTSTSQNSTSTREGPTSSSTAERSSSTSTAETTTSSTTESPTLTAESTTSSTSTIIGTTTFILQTSLSTTQSESIPQSSISTTTSPSSTPSSTTKYSASTTESLTPTLTRETHPSTHSTTTKLESTHSTIAPSQPSLDTSPLESFNSAQETSQESRISDSATVEPSPSSTPTIDSSASHSPSDITST